MSGSLAFDRAVEYYDRTRRLSDETSRELTRLLSRELESRRTLEIGVGTGLIALPLVNAGLDLVGLDLSEPMLRKLEEKAGGRPFPLVLGDATSLPFRAASFHAALVRHVLHLVPDWERALDELARVVGRPGSILISTGDIPAVWREVTERFVTEVGGRSFARGLDVRDLDRLDGAFRRHGAIPRQLPAIPERVDISLGTFIEQMGEGMHSWTWDVPEDRRREVSAHLRRWAQERYGSLDPAGSRDVAIEWRAYDLP